MLSITSNTALDKTLREFYKTHLKEECEVLRDHVTDISILKTDTLCHFNDYDFNARTFREKFLLGLLLWYFPEEVKFLAILWLEENWGPDHQRYLQCLISSKEMALGCLRLQEEWDEFTFFGNILIKRQVARILKKPVLKEEFLKKPIVPVFKGGYRDKGSIRLPHSTIGGIIGDYESVEQLWVRRAAEQEIILTFYQKVQDLVRNV